MNQIMLVGLTIAMLTAGVAEGSIIEDVSDASAQDQVEVQETADQPMSVEGVIFNAKLYESAAQREEYLLTKSEEFIEQGRMNEAEELAQYILAYVNGDSQPALDLLAKTSQDQANADGQLINETQHVAVLD